MTHDLIVIGAGPGGYEFAAKACRQGFKVAIVERDSAGGTCLNRGCIPTKALLASASVIRAAREGAAFGVEIESFKPRYGVAVARKNEIVGQLREGVMSALAGVDYINGEARFVAADTIEVNGEAYSAPRVVLATGSAPARLPIPGSDLAVTSDELLEMTELPSRVAIIGGGVIGMEFACILHEFGADVTVIEYCKEILPPFDRDIAKRLRTALSRLGINIIVGASVTSIAQGQVTYEQRGKTLTIDTDLTVMAVGRRPVIPDGLEQLGLDVSRRGVTVDENFATNIPGLYAIGDVNGLCMLAHAATAQGDRLLGHDVNLDVIPSAVFTMPECAMVGLTEEQCKERSLDIAVAKTTFRSNGKAVAMGEADGMVKLIADRSTRQIVGCHIMGPHAADLVQAVADMMTARVTVDKLAMAVHGHPTLGETVKTAAEMLCK
ncbi:MAG: dihydrolipoyl dehydrogenase [Muribaculaceae bacterium]|nr:dihydrolipoyl dehydrogenase [Muribaculaceae bacterium]